MRKRTYDGIGQTVAGTPIARHVEALEPRGYAVNHLYTSPILKRQDGFPRALGERPEFGPELRRLLGYTSQIPLDDKAWRRARAARRAAPIAGAR